MKLTAPQKNALTYFRALADATSMQGLWMPATITVTKLVSLGLVAKKDPRNVIGRMHTITDLGRTVLASKETA